MKELVNLKKLGKLKIVQIIEPSLNLNRSYVQKSEESLLSSKYLLERRQYNDSISLSYFSMYNTLLSLLYRCGIKSENHNASIFILNEVFNIDNREIAFAKRERKDKQYYPSFSTNEEEVKNAIKTAEEFNSFIKNFSDNLNSGTILKYRDKFKQLLK